MPARGQPLTRSSAVEQGLPNDAREGNADNLGMSEAMERRGAAVDKAVDKKRRIEEVHQFSVSRSVPCVPSMLAKNVAYCVPVILTRI